MMGVKRIEKIRTEERRSGVANTSGEWPPKYRKIKLRWRDVIQKDMRNTERRCTRLKNVENENSMR